VPDGSAVVHASATSANGLSAGGQRELACGDHREQPGSASVRVRISTSGGTLPIPIPEW